MGTEPILGITKLVNWLLGRPAAALLALLHIRPANPEYPIPNFLTMEFLVFLIAVVFFLWLRPRLSADRPRGAQQCVELLLTNPMGVGVRDLAEDIIGHGSNAYVPLVGSLAIFVLFCNLVGLVPGLMAPTADKAVPLGCAVVVFIYYHSLGVRHHGPARYVKTFTGPKDLGFSQIPTAIFKVLMFLIETISHAARILSLTVRLWANMMVGELVYLVFLGLLVALSLFIGHLNPVGYVLAFLPVTFPLVLLALHLFESFLQAFVFAILPIIYISFAVAEEH
jgi:F-type H+-transporting ATPase subunit a